MSGGDLRHTVDGAVAHVVFDRPQARNALTFAMYAELAAICDAISPDGPIRALVISGAGGKAFAAGTDMTQFRAFDAPEDALAYEARMEAVLTSIERCRVPTIAAITGACTGGGALVAAACDLRIADAALRFGCPIARTLGNCLSIASLGRLAALVGSARVTELIFTSRLLGADEALAVGLVSEVLPDAEDCIARAGALAAEIATLAPITLRVTKEGLRRLRIEGPTAAGGDLITQAYMSGDFREGLEAFLAKRKPEFRGC